jgi:hypothetical protein
VPNADAGVVDDHVQSAEAQNDVAEAVLHLPGVAYIPQKCSHDTGDLARDFFAGPGVAIENGHPATFFDKSGSCRCADAAGAAGNQNSFVPQASHQNSSM